MIEKTYKNDDEANTAAEGEKTREVIAAEGETDEIIERNLRRRVWEEYRKAVEDKNIKDIVFKNCYRNKPCPCGSGKKFKKCCISKANKGPFRVKNAQ